MAHRRELIFQPQAKLKDFGVDAGIIMAGVPTDAMRRVQIASVQTLHARSIRGKNLDLPPADILIIDEAHHSRARTYQAIIDQYPDAKVIGATATPCRTDGRGLGNIFAKMVEAPQVSELIKQEHLVGTKIYAPADSQPNLTGVGTAKTGDYKLGELERRMNTDRLVGDIISHWHRHADRRPTVAFASGVEHSIHLRDEFIKSGVKAEHIDGTTPKDERDGILHRLYSGDLELVTNFGVLTEGWDAPSVSCLVLARPTKSMGLYRQMVGRVLRPSEGKDHALILDHAGATIRHGFVEDEMEWTLESDRKAVNVTAAALGGKPSDRLIECTQCHAIRTAGKACDHCGFLPKRRGEYHVVHDGDLALLDRDGRSKPEHYTAVQQRDFYQQLMHISRTHEYKRGWAAHKFKEEVWQIPRRGTGIT